MTFFTVAFLFAVSGATDPELGHSGRSLRGQHRGSENYSRMMQDGNKTNEVQLGATQDDYSLAFVQEAFEALANDNNLLDQERFRDASFQIEEEMPYRNNRVMNKAAFDQYIRRPNFPLLLGAKLNMPDKDSTELFNESANDETEEIDREQFVNVLKAIFDSKVKDAFDSCDTDGNGTVSVEELKAFYAPQEEMESKTTKKSSRAEVSLAIEEMSAEEFSAFNARLVGDSKATFAAHNFTAASDQASVISAIEEMDEKDFVRLQELVGSVDGTEKTTDGVVSQAREELESLTTSIKAMTEAGIGALSLELQNSEHPELANLGQFEDSVEKLTQKHLIDALPGLSEQNLAELKAIVEKILAQQPSDDQSPGEGEQSVKEDEDGGIAGQAKDVVTGQVEEAPAVTGAAAAAAAAVAAQQGENEPADIDVEPVDLDETEVIEQSEPYRDFAKDKVSSAANTAVDVVTGLVGDETETIDGPLATPEDVLNEASNKSTLPLYPVLGSQQYRAGTPAALDNGFSHDLELLRAMPMTFNEHMEHSTEDIIKNFLKNSGLDQEIVNNLIFGLHGTGLVKHIVANVVSGLVHANAAKQAVDRQDAANNYARGHYTIGKEIVDLVLDKVKFWSKTHATAAEAAAQQLLEATPTTYGKQDPLPIEMMSK